MRRRAAVAAAVLVLTAAACSRPPADAAKRYPLHGQVMSVNTAKQEIEINHGDIPGFMPGMQMIYPVSSAALMSGRAPGELVDAVLEVRNAQGTIVEITHTGTAPLPSNGSQAAMAGGVLDVGDAVPDAAFIDQADRRRSFAEWRGTPTMLTFIYTRCPLANFCPLIGQNFATLQRRLADATTLHGRVKLVTVTFDPEHDTPTVLAAHAKKLQADPSVWTFLTGDRTTVEHFAGKFGIAILRDQADQTQITHNLRTFLIGRDGKIVKVYSGSDWTVGQILSDLRKNVTE